jgi:hypothetical protein
MGGIVDSIFGGGGGGGGSASTGSTTPTNQNITTSNIAPWAEPGVTNLINAGMGQIFETNPDGSINFNQMKGYTPFNANTPAGQEWVQGAAGSVAGFSPLQQQAQQNIANMQTPGQYNTAMNAAQQAGQGYLNTAGQANQYGNMGANFGSTAAGLAPQAQQYGQNAADIGTTGGLGYGAAGMQAGQNAAGYGALGAQQGLSYGQNATNANAVQSYMNPYLQATLNPAMQLQAQQFGQLNAQNQGQATQQGAFGGGRQAIMQGLNQQNQMLAQNQLVGNAYNQAYNTANQNMQAAANLGMQGTAQGIQGQQAAMQGAGVGLAGVNAAMQGQQTGLQGLQQASNLYGQGMQGAQIGLQGVGAQQAGYGGVGAQATNLANIAGAQTQTGLNINAAQQAAYATQQQNQQNILNQAMANYNTAQTQPLTRLAQLESMYTGAPQNITSSTYSAAPSTTSQLAGLGTAAIGANKLINGATGGLPNEFEVKKMATGGIASGVSAPKLDAMLGRLDDQQLAQKADPKTNDPQTAQAALSQEAFRQQMRPAGIGSMYNYNGAGGGIVAFGEGSTVKDDSSDIKSVLMQEYKTPIEEQIARNKALYGNTAFADKYANQLSQVGFDFDADKKSAQGLRLLQAGLGIMGGTSPFAAANIGQGSQQALAGYGEDIKDLKRQQMDLAKQQFELGKFGYSTNADIVKAAQADRKSTLADLTKIYGSEKEAEARLKAAEISAGATVTAAGISAEKAGAKERQGIQTEFDALVAQGYDPNSPITKQIAQQQYFAATRPYGASAMVSAIGQRIAQDGEIKAANTQLQIATMAKDQKAIDEANARIAARTKAIQAEVQQNASSAKPGAPTPVVTPTPVPPSAPAKPALNGTIKQNPDGTYDYVPNPR